MNRNIVIVAAIVAYLWGLVYFRHVEYLIPTIIVALLLAILWGGVSLMRQGSVAFRGAGLRNMLSRVTGVAVVIVISVATLLVSLHYFAEVDITQYHDLFEDQVTEVVPALSGAVLGDSTAVATLGSSVRENVQKISFGKKGNLTVRQMQARHEELVAQVSLSADGLDRSLALKALLKDAASDPAVDLAHVNDEFDKFVASLGLSTDKIQGPDKGKDDDQGDEKKPFNKWLWFFYLVMASVISWLLFRYKEQKLLWVALGLACLTFLAYKAELLNAWAFIQVPYTIGVFAYALFRTRQAIRDGQWYEVIDHNYKKPTKEFSSELPFHTVTFALWLLVLLSTVFIWKPELLLIGVEGPLGVFLTALLMVPFLWKLFGRLSKDIQPNIYYILGVLAAGLVVIYIGLPLFVVALPLMAGAYLLATWFQVMQGRQIVPFRSGKVREKPVYFLWRKETHVAKPGDYPVETGEVLRSFRKGDHVWLIAAFLPKQFCQIVMFPMEELSVNPWDTDPVTAGTIPWPESDKLDASDLMGNADEDSNLAEKRKRWLEELELIAKRSVTEVVWNIGITLFLFRRPGVWLDLSQEDRDPDKHQQFIKDRVQEVVNEFAKRMTLHQAIKVNLLKQDVSIKIGGRSYTFTERLDEVFMRDAGHSVHSYLLKDGDQTKEVKALQQQLEMVQDEVALEVGRVAKFKAIGQQQSATVTEFFVGVAAYLVGKEAKDLQPGDLSPEINEKAARIVTAWRLTEQSKDGNDSTKMLIPTDITGFLGSALGSKGGTAI